jgi:hypothetical protein
MQEDAAGISRKCRKAATYNHPNRSDGRGSSIARTSPSVPVVIQLLENTRIIAWAAQY